MSSSGNDRPSIGDDTVGSGSVSADGGGECSRENDRIRRTAHERKSKRVSLFRLRSGRKQSNGRRNRPSPAISGGGSRGSGGGRWLCLCFKPTPTLDSPGESQTSDPNSSELKCEFLKGLIEKNDFWSKECDTHLDVQSISSSDGDSDEKL